MTPFSIDGVEYPHLYVTSLKRSFSVLDGENTGRTMDGNIQRDIIGTYYNYTMEISAQYSGVEEYDNFYEVISSPTKSHVMVVPYAQSTYTFNAYVTGGEDNLQVFDDINKWDGLSVKFIAMSPARRPA